MKKTFYILLAALMILPISASAQQNLRSGYFLDGYIYKYKMNPAMAPERGFFAIPVLGNVGIGAETNLGLSTFLYPTESGRLTTFLSPRVSNESFLDNIAENNKMNYNLDLTLFALGFRTGRLYHTLDVSLRADGGINLPGEFFKFIKVGGAMGDTVFDVSDLGFRSSARAELAYGLSCAIGKNLRVGLRAKVLAGVFNADIAMDQMTLEMGPEKWAVNTHGNMMFSAPVSFGVKENNLVDWASVDTDQWIENISAPNFGLAFDLGATYDFLKYFTASFSVLDLGYIKWNNTMIAETPQTAWKFEGFDSINSEEMSEQVNSMTEGLTDVFNFQAKENGVTKIAGLSATINAGIEARMPFYQRLSFGALYTQHFEGAYSWSEGRFAMGLAPTRWFSLSTNYAISHFGTSWGGAVNLHLPGLGIFAGLDSFSPLLNMTPQYLPIDSVNTNLAVGLNITFGKYHGRYPRIKKDKTKSKDK